jgi:hypothetical protein
MRPRTLLPTRRDPYCYPLAQRPAVRNAATGVGRTHLVETRRTQEKLHYGRFWITLQGVTSKRAVGQAVRPMG